eukprot:TRINITY_DN18018_c0_g1_i1.p1 TRINITY_DN18018_c0_g1~~TRINITY_DN18018_c0_g1_i1.p1  ORF type:complete len:544 (-),score=187.30 TRINITY_DN18018_c0_g1_i1:86-1717(-)
MVVLAAAVCLKSGKVIVSRQFVEMPRGRTEGLLAAFGKLALDNATTDPDRQHTFIETETVRYLYQPMEELVTIIITSKNSNIVDDLDTLHLFVKLVSTYSKQLNEKAVSEGMWDLIFAFDEAISFMGYKEKATLGQIKSFVEMESHEEKMQEMDIQEKYRAVQHIAEDKARQLKELRDAQAKYQQAMMSGASGGAGRPMGMGMGADTAMASPAAAQTGTNAYVVRDTPKTPPPVEAPTGSHGLQLGKKQPTAAKANSFLDQVAKEDKRLTIQEVAPQQLAAVEAPAAAVPSKPAVPHESVHLSLEEHLVLCGTTDGAIATMDVAGELAVTIADPAFARVIIKTTGNKANYQFKTHPQIDKARYVNENGVITAKDASRPFPPGNTISVVKWRLHGNGNMPVVVNCWPTNVGNGITMNVECNLGEATELTDVVLTIPCPTQPEVTQVDGTFVVTPDGALQWSIPLLDEDVAAANIEFTCMQVPDAAAFYPIKVGFTAEKCFSGIDIQEVTTVEAGPAPLSQECNVYVDQYLLYRTLADCRAAGQQ